MGELEWEDVSYCVYSVEELRHSASIALWFECDSKVTRRRGLDDTGAHQRTTIPGEGEAGCYSGDCGA